MTDHQVRELWEKYLQGTATSTELEVLRQVFSQSPHHPIFDELLQSAFTDPRNIEPGDYDVNEVVNELLLRIEEQQISQPRINRQPVRRWTWAAAAAVMLLAGAGGYLLWNKNVKNQTPTHIAVAKTDIPPGSEGAILTLSDGKEVVLDSLRNGIIARQNGSDVKLEDGQLQYNPADQAEKTIVYNKMSTPRGRQFQMTLPDGSKVWLNAESSIRFPVAFINNERKVDITGEVYFEVTKDAVRPFIVQGNGFIIQVLGTDFNINAYTNDGAVRATLLTGSIKATTNSSTLQLKPGEQWVYSVPGQSPKIIQDTDVNHVMAWKNKRFSFNGNIRQIMNEVARWYNVEVKFEGKIPDQELEGGFTREKELRKVLEILQAVGGVKFDLVGNTLTVSASK
jgi:transmembrane sensor